MARALSEELAFWLVDVKSAKGVLFNPFVLSFVIFRRVLLRTPVS